MSGTFWAMLFAIAVAILFIGLAQRSDRATQPVKRAPAPATSTEPRRCPWCGTVNPIVSSYCGHCGALTSATCPRCGATRQPDARFCRDCGSSFAVAGSATRTFPAAMQSGMCPTIALAIRQRPLWVVFVLTLLTFGFYVFVWFGQTWSELKQVADNPRMRPLGHALSFLIPIFNLFQIADHFRMIRAQRTRVGLAPSLDSQLALGAFLLSIIGGAVLRSLRLDELEAMGAWAVLFLLVPLLVPATSVAGQRGLNGLWAQRFGSASRNVPAPGEWAAIIILIAPLVVAGIGYARR